MPQALELIRRELGPDSTVLHTREVRAGLLARLVLGKQYEVAATGGDGPPQSASRSGESRQRPRSAKPGSTAVAPAPVEVDEGAVAAAIRRLEAELRERDFVESLANELAAESVEAGLDRGTIARRLVDATARRIAVSGPLALTHGVRRVVALVGPTGVGKTTTVAKLAAHYRLRENKRVALVTVDAYRIAAVEQLRTYADIIDLPLESASTPAEMRTAMAKVGDCDLVLMDTSGRSPRDEDRIRELGTILSAAQPDEVHLVLSSSTAPRSLEEAAVRFSTLGIASILATKLDEAMTLGGLLSIVHATGLPVSYVTDGQDVPDDIAVADARELATAAVG